MNAVTARPGPAQPSEPSRKKPAAWRAWTAAVVLVTGLLLAVVAAAYLVYADRARAGLGRLEYTVPDIDRAAWRSAQAAGAAEPGQASAPAEVDGPAATPARGDLYPALWMNPKYWAAPDLAGTEPYGGAGLPAGFDYVTDEDLLNGIGSGTRALRIKIPAIRVDSDVEELAVLDLGDSRAYETPANTVGHIPATANPGQAGRAWFFGHLESPIRGEGNVFRKLPEIPRLLKNDPVDVIVESNDGEFLYRVFETSVVQEDDLALARAPRASLTLVACVPARVYDHRLLVTAELLGYRPA